MHSRRSSRAAWICALLASVLSACSLVGLPGTNVDGCYPAAWTAASTSDTPLTRFVAMGDFGTDRDGRNRQVATALEEYVRSTTVPIERVFELGDNFYSHGLIGTGVSCSDLPGPEAAVTAQALSVLQPFEFLRDRGITLTAIAGNHDYGCDGQGLLNEVDVDRWLPAAHRWGDRWELIAGLPREVTLADGRVQIIVLDSERMIADRSFRSESTRRLVTLLTQGQGRFQWRIIAAHHPLRTYGTHDGAWWQGAVVKTSSFLLLPSHALAALQVPPFNMLNQEAYATRYVHFREAVEAAVRSSAVPVALVLGGHDHQLQLLAPDAAGQPFMLVSGSAANCSPTRVGDETIFAAAKYGFAVVTAYAEHLDVEFAGTTACDTDTPCAVDTHTALHRLFTYRIPRAADVHATRRGAASGG